MEHAASASTAAIRAEWAVTTSSRTATALGGNEGRNKGKVGRNHITRSRGGNANDGSSSNARVNYSIRGGGGGVEW
jgi:hypothetical protein